MVTKFSAFHDSLDIDEPSSRIDIQHAKGKSAVSETVASRFDLETTRRTTPIEKELAETHARMTMKSEENKKTRTKRFLRGGTGVAPAYTQWVFFLSLSLSLKNLGP